MFNRINDAGAQTPQETEEALLAAADTLEALDKAEGVFGEAVRDEDLEMVAGGDIGKTLAPIPPSATPLPAASVDPAPSTTTTALPGVSLRDPKTFIPTPFRPQA